jgi:metal-responsive CopG/Arc/MetJ family transcriptional regulator
MARVEISVTVDQSLLRELDRLSADSSRSEIVEKALRLWLREHRHRSLVDEIKRYYHSLRPFEIAEDREWADLAVRSLSKIWK